MRVTKQLRTEIADRRKAPATIDGKTFPGSIPFLQELIAQETDVYARDELMCELADEYFRAGLEEEEVTVQRQRVAAHPESAIMWIALANSLSRRQADAEEAKRAAEKAVAISREAGTLIRYSLISQAWIARRTKDSGLFSSVLSSIISDAKSSRDDANGGLDRSLLQDLPEGFYPPELGEEYRSLQ